MLARRGLGLPGPHIVVGAGASGKVPDEPHPVSTEPRLRRDRPLIERDPLDGSRVRGNLLAWVIRLSLASFASAPASPCIMGVSLRNHRHLAIYSCRVYSLLITLQSHTYSPSGIGGHMRVIKCEKCEERMYRYLYSQTHGQWVRTEASTYPASQPDSATSGGLTRLRVRIPCRETASNSPPCMSYSARMRSCLASECRLTASVGISAASDARDGGYRIQTGDDHEGLGIRSPALSTDLSQPPTRFPETTQRLIPPVPTGTPGGLRTPHCPA